MPFADNDEPVETVVDRIVELIDDDEGTLEALGDLVHDSKSREGSDINNNGAAAQVTYLLADGWDEKTLLEELGVEGNEDEE